MWDQHNYIVKNNPNLKKILEVLSKNFTEKDLQKYIDKLISWYVIKYSDKFLTSLFDDNISTDTTILDIMDLDTLQKSYGAFEFHLFDDPNKLDEKIILQKNLIMMVGWGLIYYKKSNPDFGYYRACQLLNDFNSLYSWNLQPSVYMSVFERDYSPDNEENKKLIEKKKKKKDEKIQKKKFARIRELFHK